MWLFAPLSHCPGALEFSSQSEQFARMQFTELEEADTGVESFLDDVTAPLRNPSQCATASVSPRATITSWPTA